MIRLYARPVWLISGVLAVVLLVGTLVWDSKRWEGSERVVISPRWSVVLERQPMDASPLAEYYYRLRGFQTIDRDTSHSRLVDLPPIYDHGADLCLYRIAASDGRLFLEFVDEVQGSVVDLESFSRVPAAPAASERQFVGEFLAPSPLTFVPAAPGNRCPLKRAA